MDVLIVCELCTAHRDPADKFTTVKIGIEVRSPRDEENLDGGECREGLDTQVVFENK